MGFDINDVVSAKKQNKKGSSNNPLFAERLEDVIDMKIVWAPTQDCAPWEKHDRFDSWYNEKDCDDLIQSIKKKGDQEIPGLIRPIPEGKYPVSHKLHGYKYEIIYGARRHFACKINAVPVFLAKLCNYDDKKCRALMHIENAQRKDITDMERAKSIAEAYRDDYTAGKNGGYRTMANDYKESKSTIENHEKAGRIWFVDEINHVFSSLADLPVLASKKIIAFYESSKDLVLSVLAKLEADELFTQSSDKVKAKSILEHLHKKDVTQLYKPCAKQITVDDIGIIKGKVTDKGEVTIKFPPSAAKINKKDYSKIVGDIMEELGMR